MILRIQARQAVTPIRKHSLPFDWWSVGFERQLFQRRLILQLILDAQLINVSVNTAVVVCQIDEVT